VNAYTQGAWEALNYSIQLVGEQYAANAQGEDASMKAFAEDVVKRLNAIKMQLEERDAVDFALKYGGIAVQPEA
jgi:hypothetical protein